MARLARWRHGGNGRDGLGGCEEVAKEQMRVAAVEAEMAARVNVAVVLHNLAPTPHSK